MSILKLRRWMFNRKLYAQQTNHPNKLQQDIRKVAIIAMVSSVAEVDEIKSYIASRKTKGVDIAAILHTKEKRIEDDLFLDTKYVKWTGEPTCELTKAFLSETYDLLYVASKEYDLTLEYLIRGSRANIKTGVYNKEKPRYFDLEADTKAQSPKDILADIDFILDKLNKNG